MKWIAFLTWAVIALSCVTEPGLITGSEEAVEELPPHWEQLVEGSELMVDVNYKYHESVLRSGDQVLSTGEMMLSNEMLLRRMSWDDYLHNFILSLEMDKRDDVLNGITRFHHDYDPVDRVIRFEPLRLLSGPYARHSYVSLMGRLTADEAVASVRFRYYGQNWLFVDRITVVADDFRWESTRSDFQRDHSSGTVWEWRSFSLSDSEVRAMIDQVVHADQAIVRFYGTQYYRDLNVTERMQEDIAALLRAIDAINRGPEG